MLWSHLSLTFLLLQVCFSRNIPKVHSPREKYKIPPKPSHVYGDGSDDYWRVRFASETLDVGDEPWQRQRAKEQQNFSNILREELRILFPDKGEIEISTLHRLYRIALHAIKDDAPAEDVEWAQRWRKWWRTIRSPYTFDTRSAPEEFLAYTMDRRNGAIPETQEIFDFEEQMNDEYLEFLDNKFQR